MPKKFKRLVAPPKKKPSMPVASKKEPSEWDVRPGESFKKFNERLGISGSKGDKPKQQQSGEVGSGKNFKSRLAAEFAEARGLRTKRKEHLKQRDMKKKGKKPAIDVEDVEEIVMDRHRFGETVMAPPEIKVKPKNAPKSALPFKRK